MSDLVSVVALALWVLVPLGAIWVLLYALPWVIEWILTRPRRPE